MAYGGSLQFTLSSFSGDFAIDKQNQEVTNPFGLIVMFQGVVGRHSLSKASPTC